VASRPPGIPFDVIACWELATVEGGCGGLLLFPLEIPDDERAALHPLLSESEAARSRRFLAARHAERYVVAHARLRQALAATLQVDAQSLEFIDGEHGKPELAGPAAETGLQFNLSHSGGLGLVGWSWQRRIGVDVEAWREMRDEEALVRRYFSPAEIGAWEALPPAERNEAFFNLWTRKEAYIKAVGRGLSLPLASFDVSHGNGPAAKLLRASTLVAGGPWSLVAPQAGPGFSLAAVLEAGACHTLPGP
jgi:4'-phosphopantetheinyl transferase